MDQIKGGSASEAYIAIKSLPTDNSKGVVFFVEGVSREHRASDILMARA